VVAPIGAAIPTMAAWSKVITDSDPCSELLFFPTERFRNLGLVKAAQQLVRQLPSGDAGRAFSKSLTHSLHAHA
jgi:hypothetical protein